MKAVFFRQQGFSLLELIVAFAIVGISLGLIYRSMGSSIRISADMALHQQATMLGRSLLSMYDDVPTDGIHQIGQRGSFKWEINSNIYTQSLPQSIPKSPENTVTIHEVSFLIQWDKGEQSREWVFSTLLPQRTVSAGIAK